MLKIIVKAAELPAMIPQEMLDARRLGKTAAEGVRALVARHFEGRGGRRFWKEAARKTRVEATAEGAEVYVTQRGVGLRYYGGTVRPKGGHKALAIPTKEGPRDAWPYEVPGLVYRGVKKGYAHLRGLLVRKEEPEKALYYLVDETQHEGDESVLPPDEELHKAAVEAINKCK